MIFILTWFFTFSDPSLRNVSERALRPSRFLPSRSSKSQHGGTVWSSELLSARWGYQGHAAQQEEHESEESEEQNFQGSSKWRLCKSNCGTVQKSSIPSLCRPKTLVGCRRQHGLVAMANESWWIGFLPILWDSDGPGDSFQHGNHHVWGRSRCTMLSNLL